MARSPGPCKLTVVAADGEQKALPHQRHDVPISGARPRPLHDHSAHSRRKHSGVTLE